MSTAKDLKPKVVTLVFDKERHLVFDYGALEALEDYYGSIDKAFDMLKEVGEGKPVLKVIRIMLYAGLKHEDENLTPDDIKKWNPLTILNNQEQIMEAFNSSLPGESKNVQIAQ